MIRNPAEPFVLSPPASSLLPPLPGGGWVGGRKLEPTTWIA